MINIIYEDNDILVLDKPPGLVVDPAETVKQETLADILQRDFNIALLRGGIVHRLDKDTSGIILVAKTQLALDNLQSQFKQRKIKKEYLALVHGHLSEKGRIEGNIGRNPISREKFIVLGEGKEAVTEYEPLAKCKIQNSKFKIWFPEFNNIQLRKLERQNYGEFTLLLCKPLTGRTHQIRVHLKYISHPVVCDEKYVGRKMYRLDKRWCPRMFLHAKRIGFYHPISGDWMELDSELAKDLQEVLENFGE